MTERTDAPFDIKVLYDGQCPLCRRELAMLRRLDKHERIAAEDIADPAFDASRYGLTYAQAMGRIHGILPDGTIVRDVEVFRRLYRAVGLGWLLGWTAWPGLRRVADAGYRWFARHRLRLTGRGDEACDTGRCAVTR
ncbi:MAG: DUF393 domain-containing protein [Planctomycetes bacterium]|jgi:predicted DCC family thiol-disulfide oxidoreductase YuxK|nr:DUF393 domain-containing protein [Planctomycetota bacterium]